MAPRSPPSRWFADPPAADGRKVIISDTDHYAPGRGDALWAWKSFLRGHHPILMDFGLIGGLTAARPERACPSGPSSPLARPWATRRVRRADEPDRDGAADDLSSTGYALANPGQEYLVLQPSGGAGSLTVLLEPGTYTAEWFSIEGREMVPGDATTVEGSTTTSFSPPSELSGPTVLYLKGASAS